MKPLQSNRPLTHTSMKQSEGRGQVKEDRQKQDVSKYSVHLSFTNGNQCTLHVQVHSHYQLIVKLSSCVIDCMIAQQCFDGEGG